MQDIIKKLQFLNEQYDSKEQKKLFVHKLIRLAQKIEEKNIDDHQVNTYYNDVVNMLSNEAYKEYRKTSYLLFKYCENQFGLVEKGYYQNTYLALGLSIGVAIGGALSSTNSAFIAIGISMGLAIGIGLGSSKDSEAENQNLTY